MDDLTRRKALGLLIAAPGAAIVGCRTRRSRPLVGADAIAAVEPLRRPWQTGDPFLFCAHHLDAYPRGNAQMGPAASLRGRHMGRDFAQIDGWNMYHGLTVPGFPRHPHRGFETVTLTKTGLLDHSDSLGATARYGEGDVQWLTAGAGIQHAEMFPLLHEDRDNPLELFQIWLNLPAARKMVDPHFSMLWSPTIPKLALTDDAGRATRLTVVAGGFGEAAPPAPPPASYASEAAAHVAIWTLAMDPGARFDLPPVPAGVERSLYFYRGSELTVGDRAVAGSQRIVLRGDGEVALTAGAEGAELLLLQGKPIGEPVAHRGPFVMNTEAELRQAYADFRDTQFGSWPWPEDDYVHAPDQGRFALRPDSGLEQPPV
jgi:redox-sensitive bicupin YhaK (pirin superfamily)